MLNSQAQEIVAAPEFLPTNLPTALGSYRSLQRLAAPAWNVSRWKVENACPVTAEAAGSSPVVPAILFKHLRIRTF